MRTPRAKYSVAVYGVVEPTCLSGRSRRRHAEAHPQHLMPQHRQLLLPPVAYCRSRRACPVFGLGPETMWAAMIIWWAACNPSRTRVWATSSAASVARDSSVDDLQVSRSTQSSVSVPKCGLADPTPPRCRQPPAPTPACLQSCLSAYRATLSRASRVRVLNGANASLHRPGQRALPAAHAHC